MKKMSLFCLLQSKRKSVWTFVQVLSKTNFVFIIFICILGSNTVFGILLFDFGCKVTGSANKADMSCSILFIFHKRAVFRNVCYDVVDYTCFILQLFYQPASTFIALFDRVQLQSCILQLKHYCKWRLRNCFKVFFCSPQ